MSNRQVAIVTLVLVVAVLGVLVRVSRETITREDVYGVIGFIAGAGLVYWALAGGGPPNDRESE